MYKATGFTHCYTLESNYNTGKHTNPVPAASGPGSARAPPAQMSKASAPAYTPEIWYGVGRACLFAMLDLKEDNPWSRLPKSSLKSIGGARKAICTRLGREKSYRAQAMVLKAGGARAAGGKGHATKMGGKGRVANPADASPGPARRRYRPPPRRASTNVAKEPPAAGSSALDAAAAASSYVRKRRVEGSDEERDMEGGYGRRRGKDAPAAQSRSRVRHRARVSVTVPSAKIEQPELVPPRPRRRESFKGRGSSLPPPPPPPPPVPPRFPLSLPSSLSFFLCNQLDIHTTRRQDQLRFLGLESL